MYNIYVGESKIANKWDKTSARNITVFFSLNPIISNLESNNNKKKKENTKSVYTNYYDVNEEWTNYHV